MFELLQFCFQYVSYILQLLSKIQELYVSVVPFFSESADEVSQKKKVSQKKTKYGRKDKTEEKKQIGE